MTRQRFAFILRLWQEAPTRGTDLHPQLRGSLQAIDSEELHYFASFDKIPKILRKITMWQEMPNQEKE